MRDWKKTIINQSAAMQEAIELLENEALRIVLVVDQDNSLVGTITDGDIRRAIIKHKGMDVPVSSVMHISPTVATTEDGQDHILSIMKEQDLLQIPIVDHQMKLVGLETLHHLLISEKHSNAVFLMAGGFGTRLKPLTDKTPKPLLEVSGKPILEMIMERFINAGFYRFFISTHYKAEMIWEHFKDGCQWGVEIHYIHEEIPLGTAGALGLLPKELPDEPVIMMNGDLLTKLDFSQLLNYHEEEKGLATMCVREYDFQVPYGVVESNGYVVSNIVEKPIHQFFVNAGVYVLDRSVLDMVSGEVYMDMPHLLQEKIEEGNKVNMYPIHEYWTDVGRHNDLEQARKNYMK